MEGGMDGPGDNKRRKEREMDPGELL